ncbi:hypothetical protein [Vibrio paucivorans]
MAKVSTARVTDARLLQIFIDETLSKYDELGVSEDSQVVVSVHPQTYTLKIGEELPELIALIKKNKTASTAIRYIDLRKRFGNQTRYYRYTRSDNSLTDIIDISDQGHDEESSAVNLHLSGLLSAGATVLDSTVGNDVFSAHHEVLTGLESLGNQIIQEQHRNFLKLEDDKRLFLEEKTKDFEARNQQLTDETAKKHAEMEAIYQARSEELDERQQRIEDADNTTARRKTTTRMLEDVQEKAKQFSFSENVNKPSNQAVKWASNLVWFGVALLLSSVAEYVFFLGRTSDLSVFFYARTFTGSALTISSIVYLIRWYNASSAKIAQQELDNQMFVRDLQRAHLAVEMSLEWNEKKDGAIPDKLLGSLTDGLFNGADAPKDELLHPAEQIASALVRSADKVSFPLGVGKVETTGKNLAKAKSASN